MRLIYNHSGRICILYIQSVNSDADPGGQTFASCAGEDVPLSVLYGCGDRGGLASSYDHSHAVGRYSTPDSHVS